MMNIIGVDFGTGKDITMVSVVRKAGGKIELIDNCSVEEFDYSKYVASKHQIVGSKEDLEKFQVFLKSTDQN